MIKVAVAVLIDAQGRVLINRRHDDGSDLANLWEFPGGKVEMGETVEQALVRELKEEFGIMIKPVELMLAKRHSYQTLDVDLEFWRCKLIDGEVVAGEGHLWQWCSLGDLGQFDFLPANSELVGILSEGAAAS